MSMTTETKVGLMVMVALGALGWLTYSSGSIGSRTSDRRVLETEMPSATGIRPGTKVMMAGVAVGDVSRIYLSDHGTAMVEIAVDDAVKLPNNVVAQIASNGLVGEKYVALTTDFSPDGMLLPPNVNTIPSKGAASVDDMLSSFGEISNDLKSVSTSLREALGGPENAAKLTRIVNNIEGISDRLNGMLSGQTGNDINLVADNLAKITTRLEKGEGTMGRLLTEDKLLDDLDSAASNLRSFATKINNGNGSVAQLVNDGTTVDKLNTALDSLAGVAGRLENFQTIVEFNGYSLLAEDNVTKGNFMVTLKPRPTRYYVLGVSTDGFASKSDEGSRGRNPYIGQDFGDDLKFTAQFGHVYENAVMGHDVGLRLGLKNSSFGIGADMSFFRGRLETNLDVYDWGGEFNGNATDGPHIDLGAKYMLYGTNLYAMGGIDNAVNSRYASPFAGLGFRFADDDLKYLAGKAL